MPALLRGVGLTAKRGRDELVIGFALGTVAFATHAFLGNVEWPILAAESPARFPAAGSAPADRPDRGGDAPPGDRRRPPGDLGLSGEVVFGQQRSAATGTIGPIGHAGPPEPGSPRAGLPQLDRIGRAPSFELPEVARTGPRSSASCAEPLLTAASAREPAANGAADPDLVAAGSSNAAIGPPVREATSLRRSEAAPPAAVASPSSRPRSSARTR